MRWPGPSILVVLTFVAGCPWTAPTPVARVHHGPAFHAAPLTLAALPVTSTAEASLWTPAHATAVAAATRMLLEYAGFNVVDTERLNVESWRRSTKTVETSRSAGFRGATPPRLDTFVPPRETSDEIGAVAGGTAWSEAPPEARHAMLIAMGIDGTLSTRVSFGPLRRLTQRRTVTTSVTVARLDGTLVWESSCDVVAGDYHSEPQAIDLATRCALESASLW